MKYCIYCGKPIQEGQRFCTNCGKQQRAITPEERNKTGRTGGGTKTTGKTGGKRGDFDDPDDKGPKKLVILIIIIVAAALAVGGFFAAKSGLLDGLTGLNLPWSKDDSDEEDVSAEEEEVTEEEEGVVETEEEDAESEDEPDLSEVDIDAVTDTYAEFNGTLSASGDTYVVVLDDSYTIYAYDESGEKTVMNNVSRIVLSSLGGWEIEDYVGEEVFIGGSLEIENEEMAMALETFEGPEITEDTAIHRYMIVADDCTWSEAMQEAQDMGGYLVRINTREEYDYIVDLLEQGSYSKYHFYLGGRRDSSGSDYYWVDSDNQFIGDKLNDSSSWCQSAWYSGEPSFADGDVDEDAMNLFCVGGTWYLNDSSMDLVGNYPDMLKGKVGYIVEIEE